MPLRGSERQTYSRQARSQQAHPFTQRSPLHVRCQRLWPDVRGLPLSPQSTPENKMEDENMSEVIVVGLSLRHRRRSLVSAGLLACGERHSLLCMPRRPSAQAPWRRSRRQAPPHAGGVAVCLTCRELPDGCERLRQPVMHVQCPIFPGHGTDAQRSVDEGSVPFAPASFTRAFERRMCRAL